MIKSNQTGCKQENCRVAKNKANTQKCKNMTDVHVLFIQEKNTFMKIVGKYTIRKIRKRQ
jgi:hypothetical protein